MLHRDRAFYSSARSGLLSERHMDHMIWYSGELPMVSLGSNVDDEVSFIAFGLEIKFMVS